MLVTNQTAEIMRSRTKKLLLFISINISPLSYTDVGRKLLTENESHLLHFKSGGGKAYMPLQRAYLNKKMLDAQYERNFIRFILDIYKLKRVALHESHNHTWIEMNNEGWSRTTWNRFQDNRWNNTHRGYTIHSSLSSDVPHKQ